MITTSESLRGRVWVKSGKEEEKREEREMHNAAGNNMIHSEILRRRTAVAVAMEDDLFSLSEYKRCAIRNLPLSAISRSGVSSAYSITRRKRNRRACARVFKARSHVGSCLRATDKYLDPWHTVSFGEVRTIGFPGMTL